MTILAPSHNRTNQGDNQGKPANVPSNDERYTPIRRHYMPYDRIALAPPVSCHASMRRAIPGINCPGEGETWQEIAAFRAKWNLPPVTR